MSGNGGPARPRRSFAFTFGLERIGLIALKAPRITAVLILILSALAAWGVSRIKVDDSLSELFRTNTEEFRRYEEIDRRFPSSEYDVLVVVEGESLLKKPQLEAFRNAVVELQLTDGVGGLVSMLSARGKPDATGYAPPVVPDDLPEGAEYDAVIKTLKENDIVKGKFLSPDGQLALIVIALDRKVVEEHGAKAVIGSIARDRGEGGGAGRPQGAAHRRAGHAARDPQRGRARSPRLQRPRLPRRRGSSPILFFRRLSLTLIAVLGPGRSPSCGRSASSAASTFA